MFLRTKEIAYTGILMAVAVLLIILAGYLEGSTLFFLAAASFLAGIVEKNFSVVTAFAFLVGVTFLGFILAPQKLYCATFAAFSIYVIVAEYLEEHRDSILTKRKIVGFWGIKAVLYHMLLLISLILINKILGFDGLLQKGWLATIRHYQILFVAVLVFAAEALWIVFDRAYIYFRRRYGQYFRLKE